jgi:hypothetical protein
MTKYRSAMGVSVDMTALAAVNELTRAIGTANLNARGDTIDDYGNIVSHVGRKVGEQYQNTVTNRSAVPQNRATNLQPVPVPEEFVFTNEELELMNFDIQEEEQQEVVAVEQLPTANTSSSKSKKTS